MEPILALALFAIGGIIGFFTGRELYAGMSIAQWIALVIIVSVILIVIFNAPHFPCVLIGAVLGVVIKQLLTTKKIKF